MKKKFYSYFLLASLTITLPTIASAAGEKFYVGFGAGSSSTRELWDGFSTLQHKDKQDTGWKVYGGYQFNPTVGVEAFYTGLGEFSAVDVSNTEPSPAGINAAIEGAGAVLTAGMPIWGGFSLFGKLGFIFWDIDTTISQRGVSIFNSGEGYMFDDEHGIGMTFGLAGRYFFTDNIGIRLEWDWYSVGDGSSAGDLDVDLFSAGAVFTF